MRDKAETLAAPSSQSIGRVDCVVRLRACLTVGRCYEEVARIGHVRDGRDVRRPRGNADRAFATSQTGIGEHALGSRGRG